MRMHRMTAFLAACLMLLTLAACGQPAMESAPLANSTPVPPQTEQSPVPTVLPPQPSGSPAGTLSPSSESAPSGDTIQSTPTPSQPPDDHETHISYYDTAQNYITVPAMVHYSTLGYSIAYDTTLFGCNSLFGSDAYWHSEGNYLSFSLIPDLTMPDVLDGLRLQENIAMEPEATPIGKGNYPAYTLYLTAPNGLYRQFWVMNHGGQILLIELSYDTVGDQAALLHSSQTAMLTTLIVYP